MGEEQRVKPTHQRKIVIVRRLARPVDARSRKAQESALPSDRQPRMVAVEHRRAVRLAHRTDLPDKKSRSTVSCPILA